MRISSTSAFPLVDPYVPPTDASPLFGDKLRLARERSNRTMREVAHLLDSRIELVSAVERNRACPYDDLTIGRVARFCGFDPLPLMEAAVPSRKAWFAWHEQQVDAYRLPADPSPAPALSADEERLAAQARTKLTNEEWRALLAFAHAHAQTPHEEKETP